MTAVDVSADLLMNEIVSAVSNGECILFLGSAVHAPPPAGTQYSYPEEHRPPLGDALGSRLATGSRWCERYGADTPRWDLQRTALDYEIEFGREKLVKDLEEAVDVGKQPSPVVRALAELDFPLILTTNYDHLFDRALAGAGKQPRVGIYRKEEETADDYDPTVDRPFLFKIHGDTTRTESIVLTDDDYIHFVMRMGDTGNTAPVPLTFKYYFKKWPTLFVGYRLMDYNLRLLFRTLRWRIDVSKVPRTYSVDRDPDPLILRVWERDQLVRFIAEDVWKFVPELYRRVKGVEMPQ